MWLLSLTALGQTATSACSQGSQEQKASMGSGASMLRALLLLLDVGVLATGKSAGAEIDIKYAIIGTAVGVAISAGFLALKICMIKKHLFDNDSSDLRNSNLGFNDSVTLKKRVPR
ncbi:putative uncharacterized protein C10orf128 homolog isoform X2 [Puma concolor]|nr:putative uncharacterized protein C10orf128 homolog isoform X2 [Puma concolor]